MKYPIKPNSYGFYSVEDVDNKLLRDGKGVVKYKIPYTKDYEYYPVYIAEDSLSKYEKGEDFFENVYWLMDNKKQREDMIVWEHDYKLPSYNYKIPWIHGMAQGLIVSVMLRAYEKTEDKKYLKIAKGAYNVFEKELGKGGLQHIIGHDIWLEEYEVLPPAQILNGFVFITFGIFELFKVTKEKKYEDMFKECLSTIKNNLHKYDLGFWSRYNLLHEHPATKLYHDLHIKQMYALYYITDITRDKIFLSYAKKWENCKKSFYKYQMARLYRLRIHFKNYGLIGCVRRYRSG